MDQVYDKERKGMSTRLKSSYSREFHEMQNGEMQANFEDFLNTEAIDHNYIFKIV